MSDGFFTCLTLKLLRSETIEEVYNFLIQISLAFFKKKLLQKSFPGWFFIISVLQSVQHQSVYSIGPESALIEIPPFKPKFTY